tara:strand:+ start:106 stop:357 length:252 start_codon:yes stop_codon:yes gene_type:complete
MLKKTIWSDKVILYSKELHLALSINNDEWHIYKNDNLRRSAELVSASLVQLINGNNSKEVIPQLEQALRWLKEEIKDPGCPHK